MATFRAGKPWEKESKKKLQLFTAGEKAGLLLCLAMLIFALKSADVPLGFFIMSFFCFEVQNVMGKVDGKRFHFAISLLWGLCLSLFIGSVFMAFFA